MGLFHDREYEIFQLEIIKILAETIHGVVNKKAKYLTANYFINNQQININMATIIVPGDKTQVTGQLVPRDASGNALPWSSVQPTSESYTNSNTSVANHSNSAGGVFAVTRNGSADGTISFGYTALNANGETISGSNDIVFEPVGTPVEVATALTADYGTPT